MWQRRAQSRRRCGTGERAQVPGRCRCVWEEAIPAADVWLENGAETLQIERGGGDLAATKSYEVRARTRRPRGGNATGRDGGVFRDSVP